MIQASRITRNNPVRSDFFCERRKERVIIIEKRLQAGVLKGIYAVVHESEEAQLRTVRQHTGENRSVRSHQWLLQWFKNVWSEVKHVLSMKNND